MDGEWEYMWVHVTANINGMAADQRVGEFPLVNANEGLQSYMNRLGHDHWEFVGPLPLASGPSLPGPALFFKRRKR